MQQTKKHIKSRSITAKLKYSMHNFDLKCGQKNETIEQDVKHLSIFLPNIDRFSIFFHRRTQQVICHKAIITDPTTRQRCPYTNLWNIIFQKLHRL